MIGGRHPASRRCRQRLVAAREPRLRIGDDGLMIVSDGMTSAWAAGAEARYGGRRHADRDRIAISSADGPRAAGNRVAGGFRRHSRAGPRRSLISNAYGVMTGGAGDLPLAGERRRGFDNEISVLRESPGGVESSYATVLSCAIEVAPKRGLHERCNAWNVRRQA